LPATNAIGFGKPKSPESRYFGDEAQSYLTRLYLCTTKQWIMTVHQATIIFKKDFYNSILEDLKYNSLIFYAVFEDRIISMSIILFANKQMHYHLSATDREYRNLAPTNLLLYEAACWGIENGYKTFHLGGGLGSREDSLYQFKKGFNKNSSTYFCIGKKIFDKEKYDELIKIRKQDPYFDENKLFFPLYRG